MRYPRENVWLGFCPLNKTTPCTCHARKECGGEHDRAHLHPLDLPGEVLLPEEQGGEGDAAGAEAHETRPDTREVEVSPQAPYIIHTYT